MSKKKFIIPYQYTIVAHATVYADSLEEALEIVEHDAPVPEPSKMLNEFDIAEVKFSYLHDSFEIHEDDLDLYGNPK